MMTETEWLFSQKKFEDRYQQMLFAELDERDQKRHTGTLVDDIESSYSPHVTKLIKELDELKAKIKRYHWPHKPTGVNEQPSQQPPIHASTPRQQNRLSISSPEPPQLHISVKNLAVVDQPQQLSSKKLPSPSVPAVAIQLAPEPHVEKIKDEIIAKTSAKDVTMKQEISTAASVNDTTMPVEASDQSSPGPLVKSSSTSSLDSDVADSFGSRKSLKAIPESTEESNSPRIGSAKQSAKLLPVTPSPRQRVASSYGKHILALLGEDDKPPVPPKRVAFNDDKDRVLLSVPTLPPRSLATEDPTNLLNEPLTLGGRLLLLNKLLEHRSELVRTAENAEKLSTHFSVTCPIERQKLIIAETLGNGKAICNLSELGMLILSLGGLISRPFYISHFANEDQSIYTAPYICPKTGQELEGALLKDMDSNALTFWKALIAHFGVYCQDHPELVEPLSLCLANYCMPIDLRIQPVNVVETVSRVKDRDESDEYLRRLRYAVLSHNRWILKSIIRVEESQDNFMKLVKSLVYVFDGHGDVTVLIDEAIKHEVEHERYRPLLNEESMAVLAIGIYLKKAGRKFLNEALKPFILDMMELEEIKAHIDPSKIPSSSWTGRSSQLGNPKQARKNLQRLMRFTENVIMILEKNIGKVPQSVRVAMKTVMNQLPSKSKSDLIANEDLVADLIFSHWVCAALGNFKEYGIQVEDEKMPEMSKQVLKWVSDILQSMAKNRFLDQNLAALNQDLGKYRVIMMQFVRRLIDVPQHEMYSTLSEDGLSTNANKFYEQQRKAVIVVKKAITRHFDEVSMNINRLMELKEDDEADALLLPINTRLVKFIKYELVHQRTAGKSGSVSHHNRLSSFYSFTNSIRDLKHAGQNL